VAAENKKKSPSVSIRRKARLDLSNVFEYREAYKALRTSIMFAIASSPNKSRSIVVSSSEPNEYKSTLSSNLAIALSQMEVNVLLIDADFRNPTQHKIFELSNTRGLAQMIANLTDLDSAVNHVLPGLDLLTSGSYVPNPSELLGSANMADLLKKLEEKYDYVIVDTPPINVVTDALMFADITSGILLAVRQNETNQINVAKAIESINLTKSNILGAVMTADQENPLKKRKQGAYAYRYRDRYSNNPYANYVHSPTEYIRENSTSAESSGNNETND